MSLSPILLLLGGKNCKRDTCCARRKGGAFRYYFTTEAGGVVFCQVVFDGRRRRREEMDEFWGGATSLSLSLLEKKKDFWATHSVHSSLPTPFWWVLPLPLPLSFVGEKERGGSLAVLPTGIFLCPPRSNF